jgi:hypothetical protein
MHKTRDDLLTQKQMCEELGVTNLYNYFVRGVLPRPTVTVPWGTRKYFTRDQVKEFRAKLWLQ